MHPRTYHSHFLNPKSPVQPEGGQGLRPFSKAVEQQSRLVSPSSVSNNPTVLQPTTAVFGTDPYPGSEMFQTAMRGQRQDVQAHNQHVQGYQKQSHSTPAPIRSVVAPAFPSGSAASAEPPSREPRSASKFSGQRMRQTHAQSQMMSIWRCQDSWRNQRQGTLAGHLPERGVGRAMLPHQQDGSKWGAAQIGDGKTNHRLQRHRYPRKRMPPALRPQIPSIRSALPEFFAAQTETSTVQQTGSLQCTLEAHQ
jgi:hypothetical protein